MRKILFLDHDGVICLEKQWAGRYNKYDEAGKTSEMAIRDLPVYSRFDDFDQECVNVLNQILMKTDCDIVTSSDWIQWATVEEMGDYYDSQGIIKRPIDFITNPTDMIYTRRDTVREETRVVAIQNWLKDNPDVTHWVAVDDMDLGKFQSDYSGEWERGWGLTNFVKTYGYSFGIDEKGIMDKIVEYLK